MRVTQNPAAPAVPPAHAVPVGLRRLALVATVVTLLTVIMGGVVCALDASASCPGWPGCYPGNVLPRAELPPLVEGFHRLVAMITTPLVLAVAVWSARRREVRLRWLPWVALVGCLLAAIFGMMIILFTLPLLLGLLDLLASLAALVAMVVFVKAQDGWAPGRAARLAFAGLGCVIAMHAVGLLSAGKGSFTRCVGWPTLLGAPQADPWAATWALRWLLGLAGMALVLASVGRGRRVWRSGLRGWLVAAGVVWLGCLVLPNVVASGAGRGWGALSAALAVVLIALLTSVAARLARPAPSAR